MGLLCTDSVMTVSFTVVDNEYEDRRLALSDSLMSLTFVFCKQLSLVTGHSNANFCTEQCQCYYYCILFTVG